MIWFHSAILSHQSAVRNTQPADINPHQTICGLLVVHGVEFSFFAPVLTNAP